MIISLIGFMGCGKSSVGRELSQLLCCPFIDLDEAVVEAAGKSIPEIFAEDGEAAFRRLEAKVLTDIFGTLQERQCAPLAPSHFVGPSPYAGVRKCQFRTLAFPADESKAACESNSTYQHERQLKETTAVLALGGGTVMTPQCAELVKESTVCIYLRASVDTLMERLASDTESRPLLRPYASPSMQGEETSPVEDLLLRNRIETLLAERSATYEKTANIVIDTDGKSVNAIAHEILADF